MTYKADTRPVWATDEEHVARGGENCGAEWIDVYKLTGYL